MNPHNAESVHCSFCGKSHHETAFMIKATTAAICDECVEVCRETIANRSQAKPNQIPNINERGRE